MAAQHKPSGQDWALIGLRLGISVLSIALAWVITGGIPQNFDTLLIPALLIFGACISLIIILYLPSLHESLTPLLLVTGWLTAGGIALAVNGQVTPMLAGLAALSALDVMRVRWPWNGLAPVGIALVAGGLLSVNGQSLNMEVFTPSLFVLGMVSITLWGWSGANSQWGNDVLSRVRKQLSERDTTLEESRQLMRAVVEVSTALSSQSTERVLDLAMDVGQFALRKNSSSGIVSVIFLYSAFDDSLQIFTDRGLSHLDGQRAPAGKSGIIGQALSDAAPVIGGSGAQDPELSDFRALARTRSTLVVPLRAEYVNYGVMLFASSEENAFTADRLDLMTALGTQVTVALQNATLYNRLLQEKERLVKLEANARQALVRDMHDIPTQTISAVTMRAGVAKLMLERGQKLEAILPELMAIEEMSKQATAEIRHVLFKLRPLALESQGVSAALEQLADKTRKTFNQKVTLKCEAAIDRLLSQDAQDALFYIVEEAVSNARKYAKAEQIRIDVALREGQVWVRVADNGEGFDLEATQAGYNQRGSFGMINLHERAELVGGRLSIQSQQGKGTAVTVLIPISEDEDTTQARRLNEMKLASRSTNTPPAGVKRPPSHSTHRS
jgi:signal transduction histidine kinase